MIFLLSDVTGHASSPTINLTNFVAYGCPDVDKSSDERLADSYLLLLKVGFRILISSEVTYMLLYCSDKEFTYSCH